VRIKNKKVGDDKKSVLCALLSERIKRDKKNTPCVYLSKVICLSAFSRVKNDLFIDK
jgi:hypothetical protein